MAKERPFFEKYFLQNYSNCECRDKEKYYLYDFKREIATIDEKAILRLGTNGKDTTDGSGNKKAL